MQSWLLSITLLLTTSTHAFDIDLKRHQLPSDVSSLAPFAFPTHDPALIDIITSHTWTLTHQGGQSHVLTSDDHQFILKFFKDQPRPWWFWPPYRTRKHHKLLRTLQGYHLLHSLCPELSCTLWLHTLPTHYPLPVTLRDSQGNEQALDLRSHLFVLQRKVEPITRPTTPHTAVYLIEKTSYLLQQLEQHHLHDHDPRLHLNLGWREQTLVILDPGRITLSDTPQLHIPKKFLEFIEGTQ